MLFMVIENFKHGEPEPVYRRFRERGRMMPEGLRYVNSWTTANLDKCFQLVECEDQKLLQQWAERWQDLVDFEIIPVMTSSEAAEAASSSES
jgi:hypothetical protein